MALMATLEELDVGVVTTFQPTDADLVGFYLYNKMFHDHDTFPEIPIYGNNGLPPWQIWRQYQHLKYPHQDFIYFFTRPEKLSPKASRNSRRIGINGQLGTWSGSATEPNPISVRGVQGTMRKYRYEKKTHEHHGAWLMDEFTIDHSPGLALCRIKVNVQGGDRNNKRRNITEEDEDVGSKEPLKKRKLEPLKKRKLEPRTSLQKSCIPEQPTSQQMPSPSLHEDNDQEAQVVAENNHFYDEVEQMLMSDDVTTTFSPTDVMLNEAEACVAPSTANEQQCSEYSLVPQQQQMEPEIGCQEEYQLRLPQPDQGSSTHSDEQQLLAHKDLMIYGQHDFDDSLLGIYSVEFINELCSDQDQPNTLPWLNFDND